MMIDQVWEDVILNNYQREHPSDFWSNVEVYCSWRQITFGVHQTQPDELAFCPESIGKYFFNKAMHNRM